MTLVLLMVELHEERQHFRIGLQHARGLQRLDAVLVDDRYLVLEEERIDTFVLVVRTNGDEEETESLHLLRFQRLKQMIPSEGEELTAALA